MRGEQSSINRKSEFSMGSPPLARGTDIAIEGGSDAYGITPACAGNSGSSSSSASFGGDHPRLRGEQMDGMTEKMAGMGSPPLARGTD